VGGQKTGGVFWCHLRRVESSRMAPGRVGNGRIRRLAALQERCVSRRLCGSEGPGNSRGLNRSRRSSLRSGAAKLSKPWRRNLILHVADSGLKVNKTAHRVGSQSDFHRLSTMKPYSKHDSNKAQEIIREQIQRECTELVLMPIGHTLVGERREGCKCSAESGGH
jgi:hypothetical protein